MIKKKDIRFSKVRDDENGQTFRAGICIESQQELSSFMLHTIAANNNNIHEFEEEIQKRMISQIYNEIYGDLIEPITHLLYEAKKLNNRTFPASTATEYDQMRKQQHEMDKLLQDIEFKLTVARGC